MRIFTLLSLVVAAFLAACTTSQDASPGSNTQTAARTPKSNPTSVPESNLAIDEGALEGITLDVWYPWIGVEEDFFENLVDEFNAANEWGILVKPTGQNNFSYLFENIAAALPTPNRPNLAIALPEHAQDWHAEGQVADLNPYVQDPKYGLEAIDFPYVFWNQDILADERIAFPAQRTARFLLWNQSWSEELGFDAAPISADEFMDQACKAHQSMLNDPTPENDAQGGWVVDTDAMTAYAWLLAFQGGPLEGNDYRFLTPNNIAAFKFVKSLVEANCGWQVPAGDEPKTAFAARQALFRTASLEDLSEQSRAFALAGNSDDWQAIPFPGDQALAVYGSSYVVLKASPEEQLASWLFIRWLTEPEQDARWVETTHLFPLRDSTLESLKTYQSSHPQWLEVVKLLPEGQLLPQLASWRLVKVMLGDGFDYMFRLNVPSGQVAAILAQMESTSRDLSK